MGKFLVLLDDGHPLNEILQKAQKYADVTGALADEVHLVGLLSSVRDVAQDMAKNQKLRPALIHLAAHVLAWLEKLHGQRLIISEMSETEGEKKA